VDGSNNVIVTGSSVGTWGYDYATIKYSSAGMPLWTNRYGSWLYNNNQPCAVAVDGNNNVIVTGSSWNGTSFDYATIKYSAAGQSLWSHRYNGPGNADDEACGVAVDGSNNVIVTGTSWGGHVDCATIKYSSDGVPLWTNRLGYGGGYALAVDANNNVIVAGSSYGDYAMIKYSSDGVPLWTNRYNGPANSGDEAHAIALDRSGNVIVTGYSAGASSYDFATIKYVSVVPPPVLTGLELTNGTFQMRVDEVLQACTLVIEAATNLADWGPVFTNTTPTNVLFYTDPEARNYLRRFYRAFQFP